MFFIEHNSPASAVSPVTQCFRHINIISLPSQLIYYCENMPLSSFQACSLICLNRKNPSTITHNFHQNPNFHKNPNFQQRAHFGLWDDWRKYSASQCLSDGTTKHCLPSSMFVNFECLQKLIRSVYFEAKALGGCSHIISAKMGDS